MQWDKERNPALKSNYDLLGVLSLFAFLVSLILKETLLFIVFGMIVLFVLASKAYDKFIGTKLELKNTKRSIRLFPDEEAEVELTFQNDSYLPIINGQLSFLMEKQVESEKYKLKEDIKVWKYQAPLWVDGKSKTTIKIPIEAKKRGVAKISKINYMTPHLLNFEWIIFHLRPTFLTEVIVYPKPKVVEGAEFLFSTTFGEQPTSFSPYEDILSPVGTRDYIQSDPFHRVHWKASARKQTLQTKVFERDSDFTLAFVVNISEKSRLGNRYVTRELESILSQVTYMANYATKKGYPFEVYINARRYNKTPYFYLEEGMGRSHLREALELLARVSEDGAMMAYEHLLYRVHQNMYKPKTIIMFGDIGEESERYTKMWEAKGLNVYQVVEEESYAMVQKVGKREHEKLKSFNRS